MAEHVKHEIIKHEIVLEDHEYLFLGSILNLESERLEKVSREGFKKVQDLIRGMGMKFPR